MYINNKKTGATIVIDAITPASNGMIVKEFDVYSRNYKFENSAYYFQLSQLNINEIMKSECNVWDVCTQEFANEKGLDSDWIIENNYNWLNILMPKRLILYNCALLYNIKKHSDENTKLWNFIEQIRGDELNFFIGKKYTFYYFNQLDTQTLAILQPLIEKGDAFIENN